jgi:hypothetical protein
LDVGIDEVELVVDLAGLVAGLQGLDGGREDGGEGRQGRKSDFLIEAHAELVGE